MASATERCSSDKGDLLFLPYVVDDASLDEEIDSFHDELRGNAGKAAILTKTMLDVFHFNAPMKEIFGNKIRFLPKKRRNSEYIQ